LFNSLRFKLLNRQAHKVPGSGTEMQTMLDDPATYPMIGSNDEIAQLVYGAVPTNNPWNDILIQQGRTDWNISSTLVDKLKALDPPALELFATPRCPVAGVISGDPTGLPVAVAWTSLSSSATSIPAVFATSTSRAVIMSSAEPLFVKAE